MTPSKPPRLADLESWLKRASQRGQCGLLVCDESGAGLVVGPDGSPVPLVATLRAELEKMDTKAPELAWHERPLDAVRVLAARPGEEGKADLDGARVLVFDSDDERGVAWTDRLGAAGAQARLAGSAEELRQARSLDPTLIVVSAGELVRGEASPLWQDARLAVASLLVVDDERLEEVQPAWLLGAATELCAAERSLQKRLEGGELVDERIETLGPARWMRVTSRCAEATRLVLLTDDAEVTVRIDAGKIRGASLEPVGGERVEGKAALQALLSMHVGRVLVGPPDEVARAKERKPKAAAVPAGEPPAKAEPPAKVEPPAKAAAVPAGEPPPQAQSRTRRDPTVASTPTAKARSKGEPASAPASEPGSGSDAGTEEESKGSAAAAGSPKATAAADGERGGLPAPAPGADFPAAASGSAPSRGAGGKVLWVLAVAALLLIGYFAFVQRSDERDPRGAVRAEETQAPADPEPGEVRGPGPVDEDVEGVLGVGEDPAAANTGAKGEGATGSDAAGAAPPDSNDTFPAAPAEPGGPRPGAGAEGEPAPTTTGAVESRSSAMPATPSGSTGAGKGPGEDSPAGLVRAGIDDPQVVRLLEEALEAQRAHDYAKAEELVRQALEGRPESAYIAYRLALVLVRRKKHDEALEWADQAIEWGPRKSLPMLLKGDIYVQTGRVHRAVDVWQECVAEREQFRPCRKRLETWKGRLEGR